MTGTIADWHEFFSATAQVVGAMTGLIFVSLSINLSEILKEPDLSSRLGAAFIILALSVITSLLCLIPGQMARTLGAELIAIGLFAWIFSLVFGLRSRGSRRFLPGLHHRVIRLVVGQSAILLQAAAGIMLWLGHIRGLYVLATADLVSVYIGVFVAWVFLVEIHLQRE